MVQSDCKMWQIWVDYLSINLSVRNIWRYVWLLFPKVFQISATIDNKVSHAYAFHLNGLVHLQFPSFIRFCQHLDNPMPTETHRYTTSLILCAKRKQIEWSFLTTKMSFRAWCLCMAVFTWGNLFYHLLIRLINLTFLEVYIMQWKGPCVYNWPPPWPLSFIQYILFASLHANPWS